MRSPLNSAPWTCVNMSWSWLNSSYIKQPCQSASADRVTHKIQKSSAVICTLFSLCSWVHSSSKLVSDRSSLIVMVTGRKANTQLTWSLAIKTSTWNWASWLDQLEVVQHILTCEEASNHCPFWNATSIHPNRAIVDSENLQFWTLSHSQRQAAALKHGP